MRRHPRQKVRRDVYIEKAVGAKALREEDSYYVQLHRAAGRWHSMFSGTTCWHGTEDSQSHLLLLNRCVIKRAVARRREGTIQIFKFFRDFLIAPLLPPTSCAPRPRAPRPKPKQQSHGPRSRPSRTVNTDSHPSIQHEPLTTVLHIHRTYHCAYVPLTS